VHNLVIIAGVSGARTEMPSPVVQLQAAIPWLLWFVVIVAVVGCIVQGGRLVYALRPGVIVEGPPTAVSFIGFVLVAVVTMLVAILT
jgi:hypothetical protein